MRKVTKAVDAIPKQARPVLRELARIHGDDFFERADLMNLVVSPSEPVRVNLEIDGTYYTARDYSGEVKVFRYWGANLEEATYGESGELLWNVVAPLADPALN